MTPAQVLALAGVPEHLHAEAIASLNTTYWLQRVIAHQL